jgi:hypothetical protein
MRKAQAALEFLTTYGWAFIVILVMIAALAYFGVLNPSKVLPSKCLVEAGFDCKDYIITNNSFSVNLVNKKGDALKNVAFIGVPVSDSNQTGWGTCTINGQATPQAVIADSQFVLSCTNNGLFGGLTGQKVKIEFAINYTMSRGTYAQRFEGSINAPVQ